MASSLTFKSLIHFELVFVYGVRKWSNYNFFTCLSVQFSQYLLKRLSLPHCVNLRPLS